MLVSTAHQGRRNLMAAARSMPVEFMPRRIAVVIDKKTFTRELLLGGGVFVVPSRIVRAGPLDIAG